MIEVLLLEHDIADAEFITHTLQETHPDVHVECVPDAKEVLDFVFCTGKYAGRIAQQAPKLLLLDITYSHADGLSLLHVLKSYARTRLLPMVVMKETTSHKSIFKVTNSCIVKTPNRTQLAKAIKIIGHYWLNVNTSIDTFDGVEQHLQHDRPTHTDEPGMSFAS